MKKILLFLAIITTGLSCNAQAIGDWTSHTPGNNIISVDVMNNNIFAATPYNIFYFNTNDNSLNHMSKIEGLSDMGIKLLRYSEPYDVLFIAYTNTNIDFLDKYGNVTNNPDIYNKYILGNKTINNVFFKDKYAYVCCSFGIVVIDIERNEVKDTYTVGNNGNYMNINDLTACNDIFYAATEQGVYYADVNNPNLVDFSQWTRFTNHLPHSTQNFSHIVCFNGKVIANYSNNSNNTDELYELTDTTSWSYFLEGSQNLIGEMRVYDDKLVITEKENNVIVYDTDKNILLDLNRPIRPQSATYDKKRDCYWVGTKSYSLAKVSTKNYLEYIKFNGPFSEKVFSISASGNNVWISHGGYTSTWAPTWNKNGFSYYENDSWSYVNSWNSTAFDSLIDVTYVKNDPVDRDIVYAATLRGLAVLKDKQVENVYNGSNSGLGFNLEWLQYNQYYTFVTGFDFDSKNNLWLADSGAEDMLVVKKTDGSWQSFNVGSGQTGKLMVDRNDIKWIAKREGSITVFNGNTTKTVNTNASTGNLPGTANCFVTDNNGTVWIGTTDGVALFYDSRKIFNNNTYSCSRILIPRNDGTGQADYLLSGQSVLSIAVDGANNLWFGTNNGVIHTSNDGQTTYHHFTTDNSPLFSNSVNDIAIDDEGNVYFATDNGIISYKGEAAKGYDTNTNVLVYPNPVRPEHRGIVGIKGLVYNALVKIMTTSGAFVTHLQAQGGQAVWDCTDINGNHVEPGIYLIFVSDESGNETYATKVLIMK